MDRDPRPKPPTQKLEQADFAERIARRAGTVSASSMTKPITPTTRQRVGDQKPNFLFRAKGFAIFFLREKKKNPPITGRQKTLREFF